MPAVGYVVSPGSLAGISVLDPNVRDRAIQTLQTLARTGRLWIPRRAWDDEVKVDILRERLDGDRAYFVVSEGDLGHCMDKVIAKCGAEIFGEAASIWQSDPFIIALAFEKTAVVVAENSLFSELPDYCVKAELQCLDLAAFIVAEVR